MISQPRLSERQIEAILSRSARSLKQKYWRMDESDDCQNQLQERLSGILNSASFLKSNYPVAYLAKSLLNAGERFYQKRLRQIENNVTNQDIDGLSREHGIFRDRTNRYGDENATLTLDVAEFASTLSPEDLVLHERVLAGDTCRAIASQLGISHEAANKKRKKYLSRARYYFRSYQ